MKMEFSAGGVVYKKEKGTIEFALILNHDQKWTFPKGHIENREKPEAAAIREVGEEIGLKELQIDGLLEKIDYWFFFKEEKIHKFVYFYLMSTPNDTKLTPQLDEIGDARWFLENKVAENLCYKEDFNLLKLALTKLQADKS